jgi:predicted nucleic acid-binding protein
MIFVDTSFIIAWINPHDQLHPKAIELIGKFEHLSWLTTDCVLIEIGNSLARNYKDRAIDAIENILTDENAIIVGLDAELFERAFKLFKSRDDKIWGLTDCVSFTVMNDHGCTAALTYDRHFVQAGFEALLRTD